MIRDSASPRDGHPEGEVRPLSPREIEVLYWISRGKIESDVAEILQLQPRTVKFHADNAKRKLGVATRIEAVVAAVRLNLI